ncbi:hypothetical protein SCP_1302280 [Sparassis crispa]|uniref:FAD-binding domain-containing protein n=1 Tax=Sparassis crispa TaxID=139825 RepID=A0A401H1Z4_9APHY|nr:hypothetical protein SCP_1302280 [Sparassis crispa]GBE88413.1 hypothetical protein SCP_1302280 [Sparassis crispa]
MSEEQISTARAHLAIDFLIVGGGLSGLACAIALTRAGHRVVVLEREDGMKNTGETGFHMPPNMSKVLFHWGLKDRLAGCGLFSHTMLLTKYDSGEFLGTQIWDDNVLKESRGDVMVLPHYKLHRVLYDAAVAGGATVRHGAIVAQVDGTKSEVMLASGEVLTADVIIGADGPRGTCRKAVMGTRDHGVPIGISMYAATVSAEHVSQDFNEAHDHIVFVAFGSQRFVISYPIGHGQFSLHYYSHDNATQGEYGDLPSSDLSNLMIDCEPRLAKIAQYAGPAVRIPIRDYTYSEGWVHKDGRLVVIGQAAHPFPPGSIQRGAMGIEDAAVLAKLFSHLRSKNEIASFLHAFQGLRRPRILHLRVGAMRNVLFSLLEDGEAQQARDQAMREKYKSGNPVLDNLKDSSEWDELRATFGYDCEDEADSWWMKWGRLQAKSHERYEMMSSTVDGTIAIQVSIDVLSRVL